MNKSSSVIIQLVPSNRNAGPVNVAKDLVTGLSSIGLNSKIYYLRDSNRKGLLRNSFRLIKMLKKKKKKKKNYIFHSHGIIPDFLCFLLSFIFKFKWISTIHADPKEDLKFIYPKSYILICFFWNAILNKANSVVYLTEYIYHKQSIRNKTFIPNSRLIKEKLLPRTIDFNSKRKIGFCGVLTERKNIRNLVLSALDNLNYELIIAGEGPLDDELKKIANLSDNIVFLGHQDDLTYFWNRIDILILPSFAEGVPLVALEAIARGIPLILMNLNNYKNIFTDHESIFISTLNKESLHDSVEFIYKNYNSYSHSAIKAYEERFNFENWILKYEEIYFSR